MLALDEARPSGPIASESWREALFVRALRIVARECGNPNLRPGAIAAAMGISARLLHIIFAERGQTVMKQVYHDRVLRAAKLLASPDVARRSVTEIDFACGFNDSAHFSRTFAARMGMTPSGWRRQTRDEEADRLAPPDRSRGYSNEKRAARVSGS